MAGHSKWKQIKHKKSLADAKRSKAFSQLSRAITLAAREKGPDPNRNAALRTAIKSAEAANMPKDTIERAVQKASSAESQLQRVTYEAFGPGGAALVIEGITDNNNRTFAEVRKLLESRNAKMAPGGALWAFAKDGEEWKPATTVPIDSASHKQLRTLVELLEEHDDVQKVYANVEL